MNSPKLRFLGLEKAWKEVSLDTLASDIYGGGTPSKEHKEYWEGELPWISSSDLFENDIHSVNITRFISDEAVNNSATKKVTKGSVLIVSRVGVGKVAYANTDLYTSQDFTNIINPKCNPLFLSYYLSRLMRKKVLSVQGSAIKGIPSQEIKKYKIYLPDESEQEKISEFLKTLDERISIEKKEIEKIKEIKKGLNKKVFSIDGEKWTHAKFEDIFDLKRSMPISRSGISDTPVTHNKIIHYGDILIKYDTLVDAEVDQVGYLSKEISIKKEDLLVNGDIVFADAAEDYSVGKAIEVNNINSVLVSGLHTIAASPKIKFNEGYLGYFFNSKIFTDQVRFLAVGTKVMSLTKAAIMKTDVYYPSIQRQEYISNLMANIDRKINLKIERLHLLEHLKDGFMQKMFM